MKSAAGAVLVLAAALVAGDKASSIPSPPPALAALYLEAPAGDRPARIVPDGETILPNGRVVTPAGRQIVTAPHPFGLALSADGSVLVTVNGGIVPFSLTVIRDPAGAAPRVVQIPASSETQGAVLPSTFLGAAVDTARGLLYASGGETGSVVVFSLESGARLATVDLGGPAFPHAFTADLALSADGRWLYALDLAHFRLVSVDTLQKRAAGWVRVGRNPMALALSADGTRAFVANMGTFEYAVTTAPEARGLPFPAFGYPSREARERLGDPNVDEANSVFAVDVSRPESPVVESRLKTGLPIGTALGGSSPAGLALRGDTLYVANATNDSVEAWDLRAATRRWTAALAPSPALATLRGVLPFGLALSPDGTRLYVAESGINALGVLDAASGAVLGHVPTGWYPAGVAVAPDGRHVYVSNAKGWGSGPNGGRGFTETQTPKDTEPSFYIGRLMKGTVSILDTPEGDALAAGTQRVLANNGLLPADPRRGATHPVPAWPGVPSSVIKHVVFIAKENRTFDEVYGDLAGVDGDASLARFGEGRTVGPHVNVSVMPNHRALARRFASSDNFYVDSDVSADGHRWLVGAYTNHWVETVTAAAYGKGLSFSRDAPGRRGFFESNSSLTPEEYPEAGALWQHLDRNGVSFRNYGEGFEFAGAEEGEGLEPTGVRLPVNVPMPEPLFRNTSRLYPGFNMNIPDQYRADVFLKDLLRWSSGKEPMPRFVFIQLPNDHGARPRRERGYPFLESYMADNDLALGRIVEGLSRSPFWREMAVFVTEDDAQAGRDHVDAHRSLCLAIGPNVKRGYVSHRHASIASITKTIYRLLGLPHLHLYDAAASDLADMFTGDPDLTPYTAVPADRRLFDARRAGDPRDADYRRARREPGEGMDTQEEAERQLQPARP